MFGLMLIGYISITKELADKLARTKDAFDWKAGGF